MHAGSLAASDAATRRLRGAGTLGPAVWGQHPAECGSHAQSLPARVHIHQHRQDQPAEQCVHNHMIAIYSSNHTSLLGLLGIFVSYVGTDA